MTKEQAIEVLHELEGTIYETQQLALGMAIQSLEERKQGKWIIDDKEHGRIWHCHCSNCKKDPQDYIGGSENWWLVSLPDYCPNCGAKMESEGVNDSN